jgi:chemotaxis protein MotA
MKLDLASILGLIVAVGFILLGNAIEGGHLHAIIQPTAAMIVFGGTLGAVMINFPMEVVIRATKSVSTIFTDRAHDNARTLAEIVRLAQMTRKEGILALEPEAQKIEDPFFKKALLMVVDGVDSKTMQETLELELTHMEEHGEAVAKFYEAGGGFAPTIGIIGAVLGLIHVMSNLSDVAKVGEGIAVAFVATIYGVAAANIFFLPAAGKLKMKHHHFMASKEMVMHGVLALQQGQNPKLIQDKLAVYVHGQHAAEGHGAGEGKGPSMKAAA